MKSFLIVGLLFSLIGCAHTTSLVIEKPFVGPQFGMTKMQLIDLEGRPEKIEIYKKTDLTHVEFYIYQRQSQSSLEKVPVCLVDNKVVGWGKTFYEDHVSQDDIRLR